MELDTYVDLLDVNERKCRRHEP